MPSTFGCSSESTINLTAPGASSEIGIGAGPETDLFCRMRFHCNQLHELFSFQYPERALRPLPLLLRKNRRGLDEIWS